MQKPVFPHSRLWFTFSWILTVPLLIDICTGCNLFSFWIAWLLFFIITIISIVRLVHGFSQKCYKFSFGLIAQLILGAVVLCFFQLSFNHIIETPVSDPVTPTIVEIAPPKGLGIDTVKVSKDSASLHSAKGKLKHQEKETDK